MQKSIAVIDGNSLMHRAYHAIDVGMTSLDGTPTNAVFGFMQMLCKFIEQTAPDAVVCAFDVGKPEQRIADLPEYKANRPHMDEELRVQFPVIEELLESMDIPVVKVPGWEGDDILGTVAKRDEKLGYRTFLVTGDKDACQLVSDLTSVVQTKRGITDVIILDPDGVMDKYGVTPEQFPDYLGLMGDTSDNIPGIPGIGPKTATTILQKYGNIEGAYEQIDEFKGKQKEKLEANEDLAYLSRQIATIVTDLDFELDIEGISFPSFDKERVEAAFKRYSLMSPLSRVLSFVDAEPVKETVEISTGDILEGESAVELVDKALDSGEAIGVAFVEDDAPTLFGSNVKMAFSTAEATALLEGSDATSVLIDCLRKGDVSVLDSKALLQVSYPPDTSEESPLLPEDIYGARCFDVGLAAYLLDSSKNAYSFESIAETYLGGSIPDDVDADGVLCLHAAEMRLVRPVLEEALEKDGSHSVYDEIDLPLVPVLAQMERIGVEMDGEELAELGKTSEAELGRLSGRIYEISGEEFNIDSPKQLGRILFEVLGLPPLKKNKRGGYSTDATVMRELAKTEEIAGLVLEYREFSKIKSTYIDNLPKMRGADGRLHTSFNQTVTTTGRLSSSDPNLQNIPVRSEFGRAIRGCFVPLDDDSVFMSADYSQIELRLLAHLSQDEGLIKAFTSGTDFHAMTASRIFGIDPEDVTPQMRSRAKAVNFGIVYGQQAFGLSQTLDIPKSEAQQMIDAYYSAYPKVRSYLDGVVADAREKGYAETMYGRKRRIPELASRNKQVQALGERTAMNHPMQGSAADIIKMAMAEVERRLREDGFKAALILQVHDELDLSVPRGEIEAVSSMVKESMEGIAATTVPLEVEVGWGSDWAEAH